MTAMTKEWVQKAEADYDVVLLLRRSRKSSRYDAIRFHCQQCAEKYLKAVLQESDRRIPRTHDLTELLHLVLPVEPTWLRLIPELKLLSKGAVEFRYPGKWASSADARKSFKTCEEVRSLARRRLGLSS